MEEIRKILRESLPELIGGLFVALILSIASLIYTSLGTLGIGVVVGIVVLVVGVWLFLKQSHMRYKAKILIADNDPDFAEVAKHLLELEGYDVVLAYSPTEARKVLDHNDVDLAILDIRLIDDDDEQDISGLALAKAVAYHKIPKLILTNYPSYEAVKIALLDKKANVVEFLSKGEGRESLVAAVRHVLK